MRFNGGGVHKSFPFLPISVHWRIGTVWLALFGLQFSRSGHLVPVGRDSAAVEVVISTWLSTLGIGERRKALCRTLITIGMHHMVGACV
ncbi:hypothetical protein B0J12DRAFT_676733 [Macrophomina phaseolina]|uniref:Secreted protein n=1 Tax=Macrophomina phaseolina TaxID=35725 RepID=A0ABQ8G2M4_9PEZI|nr:hypothetical protein B0J12DRAFT_676733 [Macrophomina phaseolina]